MSYKTIEELEFKKPKQKVAGTHLRLVELPSGRLYIQLWSSLSKQWNIIHRYDVDDQWLKWKDTYARIYSKRSKGRKPVGRSVQLERPADPPKRTTRRKTSTVDPKDSKRSGRKQGSKSTGRVQRSTKK